MSGCLIVNLWSEDGIRIATNIHGGGEMKANIVSLNMFPPKAWVLSPSLLVSVNDCESRMRICCSYVCTVDMNASLLDSEGIKLFDIDGRQLYAKVD